MAQDIAQETWLALRTRYGHIDDETQLLKLAFGISRYVYSAAKKRDGRVAAPPEGWDPQDSGPGPEEAALKEEVRRAMGSLTGRCAELMLLLLDGYTAEEIKGRMGAARTGVVYVWIHRRVAALRKKLVPDRLGAGGRHGSERS